MFLNRLQSRQISQEHTILCKSYSQIPKGRAPDLAVYAVLTPLVLLAVPHFLFQHQRIFGASSVLQRLYPPPLQLNYLSLML